MSPPGAAGHLFAPSEPTGLHVSPVALGGDLLGPAYLLDRREGTLVAEDTAYFVARYFLETMTSWPSGSVTLM